MSSPFPLHPGPWVPLLLLTGALGGCEPSPEAPPQQSPAAVAAAAPASPPPPLPQPPVGRSELLQALDAARSAYAAGRPPPDLKLAGRRFSVRQVFGCGGVADARPQAGVPGWRWGPGRETIEISIVPEDLAGTLVTGDEANRWEAAEGYWLMRPWLRTDDCPVSLAASSPQPAQGSATAAPAVPTDGLAALFEKEGSRVGRRGGKAFTLTLRNDGAPPAPPEGYRLVIEGRFTSFSDDQAVLCRSGGPDARPVCIAAALIDQVALEDASGKVVQAWPLG